MPKAVYDCPLGWRRKYNRSRVWNFHVPWPMKFCQICQSTNFYFFHISKVFMTVLHQNMTNDRAPPKFEKWPCSTKIWQMTVLHQKIQIFNFYLLSMVLMNFSCIWVYQNWRKIWHVIFPKFRASKVLSDLPIFIFICFLRFLWPGSTKTWQLTLLHQNMTNDCAPPKFEKWPCSTEI